MPTVDQIKQYFKEGAYPNEVQFAALVDLANQNGGLVPIGSVIGLSDTLAEILAAIGQAGGTYDPYLTSNNLSTGQSFLIPEGTFVNAIKITSAANTVVSLGTALGLSDILDSVPVSPGNPFFANVFIDENTIIYATFSGTTIQLKIKK